MKYLAFLLALLICSGCAGLDRLGMASYEYKPTLGYEETEGSWKVFAPPKDEWIWERKKVTYLPRYFPTESVERFSNYPRRNSNFFFAQHPLDGAHLALWVRPITAFTVERAVWGPWIQGVGNRTEKLIDHSDWCMRSQTQYINIGISAVAVDFDNESTYFLRNGKKIQGIEVDFSPRSGVDAYDKTKPLPHTVYDLSSPQTLEDKQPYFRRDIDHPTFYFRFPMTCADLEDAVLVVDGFSHNGKPLPPLKVRLNYYDFSAVPK